MVFSSPDIQRAFITLVANNKVVVDKTNVLNENMLIWMAQHHVCIDSEGEPFRSE